MNDKNIYQRIASINSKLPPFRNDGQNKQQGYGFISIYQMYNAIRKLLAEEGVVMYPSNILQESLNSFQTARSKTGYLSNLMVEYTFSCGDGKDMTVCVPGFSVDYSDKAHNQAMTSAHKNALKQVFMIAESDPDEETPTVIAPGINDAVNEMLECMKMETEPGRKHANLVWTKYRQFKQVPEFLEAKEKVVSFFTSTTPKQQAS